jgi:hypothetical protein
MGLRAQDHVLKGSGDAGTEQGGRHYDQGQRERGVSDLAELNGLAQDGEFDLVYFDASGFSLQPYIPYAWQDIGRAGTLRISASHSMRNNVLAFLNPKAQTVDAYEPIGQMTSLI